MLKERIRNSRILIIDDQPEIIVNILRQHGYVHLRSVTDSRRALTAFYEFHPDVIALDLRMPHVDGFALLEQFRSRTTTGTLAPVLVFTADDSRKARQEALSMGAKDFVTKPLDAAEVQLRIYNLLETHWSHSALRQDNAALEERVRDRTKDLEEALQMPSRIALYLHEHWDGHGYHGLAGEAIPLEARIVSLVDAFDVIMHSRPYKEAESAAVAMECICRERAKQFDPALVDAFAQLQPESADLWSSTPDVRVMNIIPGVSEFPAGLGAEDPPYVQVARLPHPAMGTAEMASDRQVSDRAIPAVAWVDPTERRKEPRMEIDREVTVTLLGEPDSPPFQAVALDVSGTGMRILSQRPLRYQAAVKVEMGDLLLLGEVIRSEVCDRGNMLALKLKGSLDLHSVQQKLPDAIRLPYSNAWQAIPRDPPYKERLGCSLLL